MQSLSWKLATLALLLYSYSTISNLIPRLRFSFLSSFAFYFLNFSVEWTSRRVELAFRNEWGCARSAKPRGQFLLRCIGTCRRLGGQVEGELIGEREGRNEGRKILLPSTPSTSLLSVWVSTDVWTFYRPSMRLYKHILCNRHVHNCVKLSSFKVMLSLCFNWAPWRRIGGMKV